MNEFTRSLLFAAFLPALVSGAFLIPWRPWSSTSSGTRWKRSLTAVGILAGLITAWVVLETFPEFPPVDAGRWVPFLGIFALLALVAPLSELDFTGRLLLRLPVTGLVLATVWGPLVRNQVLSKTSGALHFLVAGFLMLVAWEALENFAKKRPGGAFPLVLLIILSGISIITVLDEALKYGLIFGSLAASQGAAAVVGFWGKRFEAHGASAFMLLTLLFAQLTATQGWAYFEPTYDRFLLYFAAIIVAGGLEWVPAFARMKPVPRETLRVVSVLAFLGVALSLSLSAQETDYGPYYN